MIAVGSARSIGARIILPRQIIRRRIFAGCFLAPSSSSNGGDHDHLQHATARRSLHASTAQCSEAEQQQPAGAGSDHQQDTDTADDNEMPPIQWTTHRLTPAQIEKTDRIFHKILWLDIFESAMLTRVVNERMGLVVTPKQHKQISAQMNALYPVDPDAAGVSSGGGEDAAPEEEAGPVLVDLKLTGFDAKSKIKVIKEVRSLAALGLKEAKELVESAPAVIQKGLKPEVAEEFKAKLEAAGGKVELT